MTDMHSRFRGALLGLAAGDALGTTLEFSGAGPHDLKDIVGGGRSISSQASGPTTHPWRARRACDLPRFDARDQIRPRRDHGHLSITGVVSTSATPRTRRWSALPAPRAILGVHQPFFRRKRLHHATGAADTYARNAGEAIPLAESRALPTARPKRWTPPLFRRADLGALNGGTMTLLSSRSSGVCCGRPTWRPLLLPWPQGPSGTKSPRHSQSGYVATARRQRLGAGPQRDLRAALLAANL